MLTDGSSALHRPAALDRAVLFGLTCALALVVRSGAAQASRTTSGAPDALSATATAVEAAPAPPWMAVQRAKLDNGLEVVLQVDHSLPQVAVCTTYDAGSRHDSSEPGIAALVHRMLREGGRSTSGSDYSRQVEARGGSIENSISAEAASFCTLVPKQELELALWLEAGRMTPYAFNTQNFQTRIAELEAEYLDTMQGSVLQRGLRRLTEIAFQDDPANERLSPPEPAHLDSLSLAEAMAFHRRHYLPANAVLSVSGDFDAFQVLDLAKRHLGAPRHGEQPSPGASRRAPRQTSPRLSVIVDPAGKTSAVFYGWMAPARDDAHQAAVAVAGAVLADGEASLLHDELVRKRRLAESARVWLSGYSGRALVTLHVIANDKARLDEIEKATDQVLARMARGAPLPASLLEAGKRRLITQRLERLSSNLGRARSMGEWELLTDGGFDLTRELSSIERVSAEQVRQAVLEHLVPARRTSIEIYPEDWHDPNQATMPRFHVVSSGENLTLIAKRYGSTVEAIAKMNGVETKRPIFPGQKLRVPRAGSSSTTAAAGQRGARDRKAKKEAIAYTVKKGDSLSSIAARHDISVAAILRANRIDPKKPLQIGQRLAIPVP